MPDSTHFLPVAPLRPYVSRCVYVPGPVLAKTILPKLGANLFFIFDGTLAVADRSYHCGLSGLHTQPYGVGPGPRPGAGRLLLEFSPYGLSRFLPRPANWTNRVASLPEAWCFAGAQLAAQLRAPLPLPALLKKIDEFLLTHFQPPTGSEPLVFALADRLVQTQGVVSLATLRAETPLSWRQVERLFQQTVGTTVRRFAQLCRFCHAQSLLVQAQEPALIAIGHAAGYYDQAHFSNEFLRAAGVRPKHYVPCEPAAASVRRG